MTRQILLLIRETVIYYLSIIDLWENDKWILCSKNGGINLQLFIDYTCKYLIDASINSLMPLFFLVNCFMGILVFFLKIGWEVKINIKDKYSKVGK
jgi:hypothetical protein